MQGWVSQLRKGLVELCVMKSLDKSEAYGYQVLQQLNAAAGLDSIVMAETAEGLNTTLDSKWRWSKSSQKALTHPRE